MPHVNKKLSYCRETKRYFVSFNISLDHSWQELVWFTGTQCQHGSRTYSIIWWLSKRGQQQSQSTTSHPIHHFTSFHIWLKLRYWLRLVFTLFFIKQMLPINNGCSTCRDRMLTRNVETVNRLCTRYNSSCKSQRIGDDVSETTFSSPLIIAIEAMIKGENELQLVVRLNTQLTQQWQQQWN